jgi:farnesyl diphosphate synthase
MLNQFQTIARKETEWLKLATERVDAAMVQALGEIKTSDSSNLAKAMHYAAMGGGKRIRPLLIYAVAALSGKELDQIPGVDACAVSIELFHTYSLVHDDLPCMDDDDLRRGRATVHKAFDEATALLVGDALQTMAFHLLARSDLNATQKVSVIEVLSRAGGVFGMAEGQAIDLESVGKPLNREQLERMHQLKTGALLRAAVKVGSVVINLNEEEQKSLDQFADSLGLAFQVVDDILDATADSQTLGKTAGKDAAANKPTFVSLMGLEAAQVFARELQDKAMASLSIWGENADLLRAIAIKVVQRES